MVAIALSALAAYAATGGPASQSSATTGKPDGTCGLCVLSPSGQSLTLTGNGSLTLSKANVVVDSSAKPAATLTGNGSIVAPSVGVVGTATVTGKGTIQNLTTGIAPVADPLSGLTPPALSLPNPVPSVNVVGSAHTTIGPGVYKEISITGSGGSLTLTAGTYVVLHQLASTGSSQLIAQGVSIYLACSGYPTPCKSGEQGASMNLTGTGSLNLTGPTESCSSVAVFADRNNSSSLNITGNASQIFNGAIYAKSGTLNVTGNGSTFVLGGPIVAAKTSFTGEGGVSLAGSLPFSEGLALTLSGSPTAPNVGESETLSATLSCRGHAIAGQPVTFTTSGANPHSASATTNTAGVATFSYTGTATGADTAQATFTASGSNVSSSPLTVNWAKAQPAISTKVTAASVTLGQPISDTATLSGGSSPSGSVSWNVYAASDTTCKTPLNSQPLTATLSGASATSPTFTPSAAGTYQFVATYAGDSNNSATATKCPEASEQVTVAKAQPAISTKVTAASVTLGQPISDTATLSGGSSPSGSVSWNVYAASDTTCKTPLNSQPLTATLSGASATSPTFTPSAAGTYQFVATYAGDSNNSATATKCPEASEQVTVTGSIGPITAQPQSETVDEGTPASFTASVSAAPQASAQWQVSSDEGKTWSNDTTDSASTSSASGQATSTLSILGPTRAVTGDEYRAVFSNIAGSVTSGAATLTIQWIGPIATQPQAQTVTEGNPAPFTASTPASPGASAQWEVSSDGGHTWSNDVTDAASTTVGPSNQTTSTLTIAAAALTQNGNEYRVQFSNVAGSTLSSPATLTVERAAVGGLCTDTYSGPNNGLWQTSANWSTGKTPTARDIVCVGAEDTVQATGGENAAGVLLDLGGLVVSGGSLDIAGLPPMAGLETSNVADLTLTGGTLNIASELDVTSAFNVTSNFGPTATLTGAGKLVTKPGSTNGIVAPVETCDPLTVNGATLVNEGTLTFGSASPGRNGGTIVMENGAQLQNSGTFNDDSVGEGCGFGQASFHGAGGAASSITNTGTFNTNTEGSSQAVPIEVAFNNQGTMDSLAGITTLSAGGSGVKGTWEGSAGAQLQLTGGSFSISEPTFAGPGLVGVDGASVSAADIKGPSANLGVFGGSLTLTDGTASIADLTLVTGTLNIASELDVTSAFNVTSNFGPTATLTGAGKLVTKPGSTNGIVAPVETCDPLTVNGATLVNEGTLTFGSASPGRNGGTIVMENGAQLQNSGTFNDDSVGEGCGFGQASFHGAGGAASSITNTGTFNTNTEGSSQAVPIEVAFNNQGTMDSLAGITTLSAGGSGVKGTWEGSAGAQLQLTGGSFSISEPTFAGPGLVGVDGASVSAADIKGPSANLGVFGGSLTLTDGTASIADLTLVTGTLNIASELDVTSAFNVTSNFGPTATLTGAGKLVTSPARPTASSPRWKPAIR